MRNIAKTLCILVLLLVCTVSALKASDTAHLKRDNETLKGNMNSRLQMIRQQLRENKFDLATSNINHMTETLERMGNNTKRIRSKEPGYSPNPPVDFDNTPASLRQKEYLDTKNLAIAAGRELNEAYAEANKALSNAKSRQLKTIAISMLKFTIDHAPGRPGGKVVDIGVESLKKLNAYLMDKYVSEPIVGKTEIDYLQGNFVSIRDGEKLMARLDETRRRVLDFAREMDTKAKQLDSAVAAEKKWQAYRWLKEAGSGTLTVRIVDVKLRDFSLFLNGVEIKPNMVGKTLTIPASVNVTAKVKDKRRAFCLERKEYAKTTKTIVVHPGPGGEAEDHLIFSSTTIPGKTTWLIASEIFNWNPSNNTTIEDNPRAVRNAYWKQEKSSILWHIRAKPGETANLFVTGNISWNQERNLRGNITKNNESNTGAATIVLKIEK